MARARNIKPSIMDNEDLAALPALTRLLFIYMWMLADREGRLEDRPGRIKKQALGYDDGSADEMLKELAEAGFIERYEASGAKVIQILSFNKHQTPHIREAASELPCKDISTTKAVPSPEKEDPSPSQGEAKPSPRSPDSPYPLPDSLIPDTPTLAANAESGACVLKPGAVCMAMKAQGIGDVSPGNAELLMLIATGAGLSEFEGAAATATSKNKGFSYALGIVKRSRQEAAAVAPTLHKGAMPVHQKPQPKTFAERDREAGWARWEEQTGRVHPDRVKAEQPSGQVIDITPRTLEIAQ